MPAKQVTYTGKKNPGLINTGAGKEFALRPGGSKTLNLTTREIATLSATPTITLSDPPAPLAPTPLEAAAAKALRGEKKTKANPEKKKAKE